MTALGFQIAWLAVRVSVFALCAAPMVWWFGRRSARGGAFLSVTSMAIVLLLSAIAMAPLPQFGEWLLSWDGVTTLNIESREQLRGDETSARGGFDLVSLWVKVNTLAQAPEEQSTTNLSRTGLVIVAILYCLGVALAELRLLFALSEARKLCRVSQLITDQRLFDALQATQSILGYSSFVNVRECREPGLAATFGSWRPVIILPPEWRRWSDQELQAVLAHELSHICHRDSLSRILSRICQVLHFYNPIVHWLSAQLRWHQELAADLLAMSTFNDRHDYVKSLASIALHSPARTPAKALLGSAINGSDLIRRIEMLRRNSKTQSLDWRLRGVLVAVLSIIGLTISSLGGWTTPPGADADQPEPFEIGYLPKHSKGFVAVRPAVLFEQPGMDGVKAKVMAGVAMLKDLGCTIPEALRPENVEQFVADAEVVIKSNGTGKPGSGSLSVGSSSIYVRMKDDFDWPGLVRGLSKKLSDNWGINLKETQEDGVTVFDFGLVAPLGPGSMYVAVPDRRSVIICTPSRGVSGADKVTNAASVRQLVKNAADARKRDWGCFDKVARAPIAAVLDNRDEHYGKALAKDHSPELLKILTKVRHAAIAVEVGEGRPIRAIVQTKSDAVAADVHKGLSEFMKTAWREIENAKPEDKGDKVMHSLADDLHRTGKLEQQGASLEWQGVSSVRVSDVLNLLGEQDAEKGRNNSSK